MIKFLFFIVWLILLFISKYTDNTEPLNVMFCLVIPFIFFLGTLFFSKKDEQNRLIGVFLMFMILSTLIFSFVFPNDKRIPEIYYNFKFDYNKNQIVNLNNDKVIDNLHYFKPSFRTKITVKDMKKIEKRLSQEENIFCIFGNISCLNNILLFDDNGNHYIIDYNLKFKKEYILKEIYFNKNNFNIKRVYVNKDGNKLFSLQENIPFGEFNTELQKYSSLIEKIKVDNDVDLFIINN